MRHVLLQLTTRVKLLETKVKKETQDLKKDVEDFKLVVTNEIRHLQARPNNNEDKRLVPFIYSYPFQNSNRNKKFTVDFPTTSARRNVPRTN